MLGDTAKEKFKIKLRNIKTVLVVSWLFLLYFWFPQSDNIVKVFIFENYFYPAMLLPSCSYLCKVNNGSTKAIYEICSKLTIKTLERRQWDRLGVFIVNIEQIPHIVIVLPLLTLNKQMPPRLSNYISKFKQRFRSYILVSFYIKRCFVILSNKFLFT